jgi:hypothetical protein
VAKEKSSVSRLKLGNISAKGNFMDLFKFSSSADSWIQHLLLTKITRTVAEGRITSEGSQNPAFQERITSCLSAQMKNIP